MIKSTEKPLGFTRFGHVGNQIQIYCVIDMLFEISRKIWLSMQINKNSNVLIYISKLRITIPMLIVAAILSYYFYLNNMLQISSEIVILNTNVALLVIVISFIINPPPHPPHPKKKTQKRKANKITSNRQRNRITTKQDKIIKNPSH